jgi:hypothetical protein
MDDLFCADCAGLSHYSGALRADRQSSHSLEAVGVFFVSDHCRLDDFRCSRLSRQLRPLDDRFPSRGRQSRAMGFLAGKRVVGWTSGLGWTMDLAPLPLHSHHLHASTTLEVAATQEFSTDWPSSFRGGRSALSKTLSGDEGFTVRFNPAR